MTDVGALTCFDPWPDCQVHLAWGPHGAGLAAARGDIVVVVDVLSFSTTLGLAVSRDFTCLVYSATEIEEMGGLAVAAASLRARPLSKRRRVAPGQLSLSPQSLLAADPGQRVLFTSLNGAAAVSAAADAPALLIGGLRNASACASAVARMLAAGSARRVTVVACGEHRSSVQPGTDGLRPSIEDWVGAGLICSRLAATGLSLSVEAEVAASAARRPGPQVLADCISARELVAAGFADDVVLALDVDADHTVPVRVEDEATKRVFTADRKSRWPL